MVDFDNYKGGIYGFILMVVVMTFFAILFASAFVLVIVGLIDELTSEKIGTKLVKCIDERGREFENEMCEKEICCSWLGFVCEIKCKDWKEKIERPFYFIGENKNG